LKTPAILSIVSSSARVLLDLLPSAARVALRPIERAGREELAEVFVALVAFDEKREALLLLRAGLVKLPRRLEPNLGAHDGLDADLFRRGVKARRTVDAVFVDDRHGWQILCRGVVDEILRQSGAVEEGEGGGGS